MITIRRSLKELLKEILPASTRDLLARWRTAQIAKEHSLMPRRKVETWLGRQYEQAIGAKLDLSSPVRYTEKIQWCKLHAMDATKSILADKYAVRQWVADRIGEEYLIPLLGVWDDPGEIDFHALPESFVLKTNNASGTNVIVPDKSALDEAAARCQLKRWLALEFGWLSFEPQYLPICPKVIAEQFICNSDGSEAADYKFICFAGKAKYIRIDLDRHGAHTRVTFDRQWAVQDWCEGSFPKPAALPPKPECLDELLGVVEALATGFGHVRVDFYVVDNRPLFGEMTFSSGTGFERIAPDEWDAKLGELWDLGIEPVCELPYGAGMGLWRHRWA